ECGTSTGRVILFGTIATTIHDTTLSVIPPTTDIDTIPIPTVSPTIPPSPDYTAVSPDYSPASDMEFDPSKDLSSDHIPPLPATLPFLSSTDDSSDSYIPDTPPSPTHGTPFIETTFSTQSSPIASGALRCQVMVITPGQPIPHGRSHRYHLNGPVHMMTVRKRVGPLPTHRIAERHLVDYSSSDHFSLDDSPRDSSSSSSSETSSDSSADALSDSASSHSSSDHSLPPPSSATDLKGCSKDSLEPYVPREARLGVDFEDESSESSRDRRVDIRGTVEVRVDRVTHLVVVDGIPEPAQEGAVEVIKSVQRYQRYNIVTTRQQSADILERIRELEQDNRRLRDMMDVASQRVARSQRRELHVRREIR
ncbi:hypothetical protein Tco_1372277, partial [Tanacetum coccineum]